jgi:TolA-binding protein
MALTRKSLKAMGLTDEQVDSIVEMHTETVDGLKDKLKQAEEKAEQLDGVQKQLDDLKAKGEDGYKEKYEKEHKAFEDFKNDVTAKESKAAKLAAAKAYFEGKNITGANLDIAMRGARDEIDGLEMDGDKIKDTAALDALVSGTYAGLVVTTTKQGVNTATPPANGGKSIMTKDQIIAIKDTAERQKAIADNHELFGF